jgi:hypothetical protein
METKMKNIILQHFDGNLRELDKLSIDNIQEYASKLGAEYKLIQGKPFRDHLTAPCQKVYMLDKEFDIYDQVLMLDIDMFVVKNLSINIFDQSGIGLYSDTQIKLHKNISKMYKKYSSISNPYWGGAIYKMDFQTRVKLRNHLDGDESWMKSYNKAYHFEDEGIMHTLATKENMSFADDTILDKRWCQCSFLPNPQDAYMIHIRTKVTPKGPKREKIENYRELKEKGIL